MQRKLKVQSVLRNLRIAWSAVWCVVALSPCVLWIRSYWKLDVWVQSDKAGSTNIRADAGLITYCRLDSGSTSSERGAWVHVADDASVGMIYWQFDWAWRSDIVLIRTPVWAPVLAFAIVAGIPWIRWSTQFTIRTMLIAMTLIALALGMIVSFE